MIDTLIQDVPEVAESQATEMTMSIWEMTLKGGVLMIPIFILSIIAVYIFFERYFAIRNASKEDPSFMERIKDYIHAGQIDYAINLCQHTDNTISRMLEKGINRIGRPLNDISTAIDNIANLEIAKLEKSLPALASVAGGAPMLGFLGTVTGMIRAFTTYNAGSNIDVQLLSSGIYGNGNHSCRLIVGITAYLHIFLW